MKENIDSVKENIKEDNIELIKEIIIEEEPTIKEQFQTTFEFDFNNKDDGEFSFTAQYKGLDISVLIEKIEYNN